MKNTGGKSTETLSQEEIDRLLTVISSGKAAVETGVAPDLRKIRIYDFKRPDKFSKDQTKTILIMHDVFARLASTSLSTHLRCYAQVHVASVDQLTYEEFTRSIPNPTTLAIVQMDPLTGSAVLEIDPAVTFSILDRQFGGVGEGGKLSRELTDIEQSVMESIIVRLLGNLRESWSSVVDLRPRLGPIETNPQFAQIVPQSEMVVLVTMEIKVGDVEGMMNFCIPDLTLDSIAGKLSARSMYSAARRTAAGDGVAAMRDRLKGIEVDVVAEVGRVDVTMREVLQLRRGDVIRLTGVHPGDGLPLKIGGLAKFSCRPGVMGSRRAVQVVRKIAEVTQEDLAEPIAAGVE